MKHLLTCCVVLCAAGVASAQDDDRESRNAIGILPRVSTLWGSLSGSVKADEATVPLPIIDSDRLRFRRDLDLERDLITPIFEVALIERRNREYFERLTLSFWSTTSEGTATPASPVTYNGKTFAPGQSISSDWNFWSAGIDGAVYDDAIDPGDQLHAAVLVGLRYNEYGISLASATVETDERVRLLWIGAGLRGENRVRPNLTIAGSAMLFFTGGGEEDIWGFEVHSWSGFMFEGAIGLRMSLSSLQVEGGLKVMTYVVNVQVDDGDNYEDNDYAFSLGGPYLSLTFRF